MNSFSIYIHLPYCAKKCPYCDFNSYYIAKEELFSHKEKSYTQALLAEIDYWKSVRAWENKKVSSIFFGGGTPSLFSSAAIKEILEKLEDSFAIQENCEISLEANPGSIHEDLGKQRLQEYREVGVNRISLGIQSFDNAKLKKLGRLHNSEESAAAIENVKAAGFDNFNLDLMFGIYEEEIDSWRNDIKTALSFGPKHIASYGLTIEPGTEFGRLSDKGEVLTAEENLSAEMYQETVETLEQAGIRRYEISNFAQQGYECRHNQSYWNRQSYLGLGAGAHSFSGDNFDFPLEIRTNEFGIRWWNLPGPEHYIQGTKEKGYAINNAESLDLQAAEIEFFMLHLRQAQGFSLSHFEDRFKRKISASYLEKIGQLCQNDFLIREKNQIKLSNRGFLFANSVLEELITTEKPPSSAAEIAV